MADSPFEPLFSGFGAATFKLYPKEPPQVTIALISLFQIRHLDLVTKEQLILKANFTWLPLRNCKIEL